MRNLILITTFIISMGTSITYANSDIIQNITDEISSFKSKTYREDGQCQVIFTGIFYRVLSVNCSSASGRDFINLDLSYDRSEFKHLKKQVKNLLIGFGIEYIDEEAHPGMASGVIYNFIRNAPYKPLQD